MINYTRRKNMILAIMFIVVAIFLAFTFTIVKNSVFPENSQAPVENNYRAALLSVDNSRSIEMDVRGPIVSDDRFYTYRITISPVTVDVVIMKGYSLAVAQQFSYPSSTNQYEQFVYALDNLNFTDAKTLTDAENETRGICTEGSLYTFSILNASHPVQTLWGTNCNYTKDSLKASLRQVSGLFYSELPDAAYSAIRNL